MNKLVEHMEKHHAPYMTAYESTRPETVMKETGWTREEIFQMAMEAWKAGHLSVTIVTGQQRWTREEYLPEDLSLIGVYSPVWKKQYRRNNTYRTILIYTPRQHTLPDTHNSGII